jgi:hypothetical protein
MPDLRPVPQEARDLGFPAFPVEKALTLSGTCAAWVPGMRVSPSVDWHFLLMHSGDIRRFVAAGGSMERAVVHHLTYDAGIIDPLWGKESFHKRVAKMKSLGVENVVAPDFSSWADFPLVVQLHNYYKSAVVSRDLATAGFRVLPHVAWSAPQINRVAVGLWTPGLHYLVDGTHFASGQLDTNRRLFEDGAAHYHDILRPAHTYLWANSPGLVAWWHATFPSSLTTFVPSRATVLGRLGKERAAAQKENHNG